MPGSAPKKAKHKYVPERTITIEGGDTIKADKDVYVKPRAVVKFSNLDSNSYTITFLLHDQNPSAAWPTHADVDLFLPAFGSATMVADPDISIGQCPYTVELTDPSAVGGRKADAGEKEQLAASSDPPPLKTRLLVERTASRGGGGGTIHIGG
jgi:hypothetical protein